MLEAFAGASGKPVASLVRLELETGRTHQIRVHLAHIGHPIVGDPVYAAGFKSSANLLAGPAQEALAALGRQALHAAELGFMHPMSGHKLMFHSDLPPDMSHLVAAFRAAPRSRAKR
jgi:23S rRNA pseudouridine1911/1915/1917 synthase